MLIYRIICLLIGYICGLFQTAYIYGKIKRIDIREHGSGNAGTTNALRTLGKKAGLITFLGDILKPVVAMTISYLVFKDKASDAIETLCLYTGAGAVLGHIFPVYLGFRGGKGIATLGGVAIFFSILSGIWYALPVSIVIFVIVVAASRYVSLGSLILLASYLVQLIIYGQLELSVIEAPYIYECYVIFTVLFAISYYKHWANVKRLIAGTENKLGDKKK